MEEQHIYQYSVRYELWLILKKWLPRFFAVLLVFLAIMEVAKRDALFLAMNMLGFMIALPPAYILMSKFFKVDYFIFLVTNLEERTITPYFIPKKLFNEGKWVIEGVRSGFRCKYGTFKDSEIDRILKEISKIDEEIGKLGREKEAILKDLISTPKRFKRFRLSLTNLESQVSNLKTQVSDLETELESLKRGVERVRSSLTTLPSWIEQEWIPLAVGIVLIVVGVLAFLFLIDILHGVQQTQVWMKRIYQGLFQIQR